MLGETFEVVFGPGQGAISVDPVAAAGSDLEEPPEGRERSISVVLVRRESAIGRRKCGRLMARKAYAIKLPMMRQLCG